MSSKNDRLLKLSNVSSIDASWHSWVKLLVTHIALGSTEFELSKLQIVERGTVLYESST